MDLGNVDKKTLATLAVSFIAAFGAILGHSLSPADQTNLTSDFTAVADIITLVGPIVAGLFHKTHSDNLANSNQSAQKASQ